MADLSKYYQLSQQIANYIADDEKKMPAELEEWVESDSKNKQMLNEMLLEKTMGNSLQQYDNIDVDGAWTNINKQLFEKKKPIRKMLWFRIAVAASLVLALASVFYYNAKYRQLTPIKESSIAKNDIAPGKYNALLTLSDGRQIVLSDAHNGELAKEGAVSIQKTKEGQVVYSINGSQKTTAQDKWNTIATSRGQQFQVVLPDGTKVWLNAASSIQFPSSFIGLAKRSVRLIGEAYFEVSKDRMHPFIVKSDAQQVEVLGTHFNISAYQDEKVVKTTLLEGVVKVNDNILKPNQQSVLANGHMNILDVTGTDAIDWKNGEFICRNEPLESIMKKISRWYDVEIVYNHPELKTKTFSGSLSRYDHVSGVLKALELAGDLKFKLEGKTIQVQ